MRRPASAETSVRSTNQSGSAIARSRRRGWASVLLTHSMFRGRERPWKPATRPDPRPAPPAGARDLPPGQAGALLGHLRAPGERDHVERHLQRHRGRGEHGGGDRRGAARPVVERHRRLRLATPPPAGAVCRRRPPLAGALRPGHVRQRAGRHEPAHQPRRLRLRAEPGSLRAAPRGVPGRHRPFLRRRAVHQLDPSPARGPHRGAPLRGPGGSGARLRGGRPHALAARPAAWRLLLLLVLPFLLVEATARAVPLLRVKRFNTLGAVDSPRFRAFTAGRGALDFERWSLDAWTVIRSEAIPQQWEGFRGWGLSRRYRGPVPRLRLVNYNLRFSTYVTEFDGDLGKLRGWLDADLISLHYLLGRSYPRVLNIGAGGGREVLNALNHDAREITAVDISEVVTDEIMRDRLRAFSGDLFFHPKVRAIADEGRSFVERSAEQYDLVDFTIVGGTNLEKLDVL